MDVNMKLIWKMQVCSGHFQIIRNINYILISRVWEITLNKKLGISEYCFFFYFPPYQEQTVAFKPFLPVWLLQHYGCIAAASSIVMCPGWNHCPASNHLAAQLFISEITPATPMLYLFPSTLSLRLIHYQVFPFVFPYCLSLNLIYPSSP